MGLGDKLFHPAALLKIIQIVVNVILLGLVGNHFLILLFSYDILYLEGVRQQSTHLAVESWIVVNLILLGSYLLDKPWHKFVHIPVCLAGALVAFLASAYLLTMPAGIETVYIEDLDRQKAIGGILVILGLSYLVEGGVIFMKPFTSSSTPT